MDIKNTPYQQFVISRQVQWQELRDVWNQHSEFNWIAHNVRNKRTRWDYVSFAEQLSQVKKFQEYAKTQCNSITKEENILQSVNPLTMFMKQYLAEVNQAN